MANILGEIWHLFCCPPRPSHIVAKLAFLPPTPTYSIITSADERTCRIAFKPEARWDLSNEATSRLDVFYTVTRRQSRIVCLYISAESAMSTFPAMPSYRHGYGGVRSSLTTRRPKPHFTILFSHGNAVDIGQMTGFLHSLAARFEVNILCYDYSGYGASTGQPLEDNLYADAEAALHELRERYHIPLDQIVLYGQSIGTAPTVELATRHKVAGVVLHSALMSGLRVVCPGTTRRFCFDPFTNIDKVASIQSPTLVMHGTDDEVIGIHHGKELHARLAYPLEPAWVEGAGHNDIEIFAEYAIRLDRLFNEDLHSPSMSLEEESTTYPLQVGHAHPWHSAPTDNSTSADYSSVSDESNETTTALVGAGVSDALVVKEDVIEERKRVKPPIVELAALAFDKITNSTVLVSSNSTQGTKLSKSRRRSDPDGLHSSTSTSVRSSLRSQRNTHPPRTPSKRCDLPTVLAGSTTADEQK